MSDGGLLAVGGDALQQAKDQKWIEIATKRDDLERKGFPYMGHIFDSDERSVTRLNTTANAAMFARMNGVDFTETWTSADNVAVTMTRDQLIGLPAALSQRQLAEDRLNERVKLAKETEDGYKNQVSELESKVLALGDLNSDLDRTLDRLRINERDLRSRLDKLSAEAEREYAVAATEAFREVSEALATEQRAHQETSAEAERYWLGWRALDRAWDLPVETKVKVKVKEDGQ